MRARLDPHASDSGSAWTAAAVAALASLALACDPPCEGYWQAVCEECGAESGACQRAREVAEATLDEGSACASTRRAFEELGPLARSRWCGIHDDRPADEAALQAHAYDCGRSLRVRFGRDEVEVGDERFRTYDRHRGRLGVQMTPSEGQYCSYHLGPHEHSGASPGLWIDCTVPLGALTAEPTFCVAAAD